MILYRIQINPANVKKGHDAWQIEWEATKSAVLSRFAELVEQIGATNSIYADEMEVQTGKSHDGHSGRDNTCAALNSAQANRDAWKGKELKSHEASDPDEAGDALEDLFG